MSYPKYVADIERGYLKYGGAVYSFPDEIKLEIGYTPVVIDKLYGSLASCDIRVYLQYPPGDWVVERWRDDDPDGLTGHWEEMCRFDCQESMEFREVGE